MVAFPSVDGVDRDELVWKATSAAAAVGAGLAVRAIARAAWRAIRDDDPPANPADPFTSWGDALIWSISLGIGAGVGRMLARRGAAKGWQHVTGQLPPDVLDLGRMTNRMKRFVPG